MFPAGHFLLLVLGLVYIAGFSSAGNTTCISRELDWYTDVVGETPCRTYERLRQICNQSYQVGDFRPLTPGDNCDDQVPDCCCNSIAFSLSMLCMNCQQCTSMKGPICTDAGKTAYSIYQSSDEIGNQCSSRTPLVNQKLPKTIQSATCNNGIRIPKALYVLYWRDGDWFYIVTRDTITKDFNAGVDSAFYACPSVSSKPVAPSQGTPTTTPSQTSGSSSQKGASSTNLGAIVGGVIGGVFGLALILWFLFVLQKKRQQQMPGSVQPFPNLSSPVQQHAFPVVSDASPYLSKQHLSQPSGSGRIPGPAPASGSSGYGTEPDSGGRHLDGGPLGRSPSGRLPPSYGEWVS